MRVKRYNSVGDEDHEWAWGLKDGSDDGYVHHDDDYEDDGWKMVMVIWWQ